MNRTVLRILLPVAAIALTACSSDDKPTPAPPPDTGPPTVAVAEPAEGAADLPLLQPFTIIFSEAMDPASLNPQTVRLGSPEVALQFAIPASGDTLVLQPDSLLPAVQALTLAITGATDVAGNNLAPYALHVTTGALDCAHLEDRFEPNELPATATRVQIDTTYSGLATCQNDVDCFRVTIDDTLSVVAETFIHYAVNDGWQMYWERADGEDYATLGTTVNTGWKSSFPHTFLPGTYYLVLYSHAEEERILYDLKLRSETPCPDDPYEDNDFEDRAAPITAGLHEGLRGCFVDADWYSVPIRADQNLILTTDTHDYLANRRLIIRTPDGGGYQTTLSGVSTLTINWISGADGDARVMSMVWGDGIVYDLTIEITD